MITTAWRVLSTGAWWLCGKCPLTGYFSSGAQPAAWAPWETEKLDLGTVAPGSFGEGMLSSWASDGFHMVSLWPAGKQAWLLFLPSWAAQGQAELVQEGFVIRGFLLKVPG